MAAEQPKIVAYMKPVCGWSQGVRAVLGKYGLEYEDKDIVNNPYNYAEMVRLTGQYLQPSLQIGDDILPDMSVSAGQGHRPVHGDRGDRRPARLRGIERRTSSRFHPQRYPPAPGPPALCRKTRGAGWGAAARPRRPVRTNGFIHPTAGRGPYTGTCSEPLVRSLRPARETLAGSRWS